MLNTMEGEDVNNQQAQQPPVKQEGSNAEANKEEESNKSAPEGKQQQSSTNGNKDPNTTDANDTIIEGGTDVQTYHSLMSLMKSEPYYDTSNATPSPAKPPSQKTDTTDNASHATDYASLSSSKKDDKENLPKMSDVIHTMDTMDKIGRFDSMSSTNAVCSTKHRQSKRRCLVVTSICVGVAALCGSLIYFVAQGSAEGWVSSNILGPSGGDSHYLRKLPLSRIKESNDRMAARATSVFQFLADESWVSSVLGGDGGHHNLRKATLPSSEAVARVAAKAPRVHSKEAKHHNDQLSSSSADDLAPNLRIARAVKRIMNRLLHQEDVGSDDEKEKRRQTMAMAADQGRDYSFMYDPQENQGPPPYYADQYAQNNQDYGGMMDPGARHLQMMHLQQQGFQQQFQNQGQQQQFQQGHQENHYPQLQQQQGDADKYYAHNHQDYGLMMAPHGGAQQQGFEQQQGFQQQFQEQEQQHQFQQGQENHYPQLQQQQGQVGGFMNQPQQFQQQQGGQGGYNQAQLQQGYNQAQLQQ